MFLSLVGLMSRARASQAHHWRSVTVTGDKIVDCSTGEDVSKLVYGKRSDETRSLAQLDVTNLAQLLAEISEGKQNIPTRA